MDSTPKSDAVSNGNQQKGRTFRSSRKFRNGRRDQSNFGHFRMQSHSYEKTEIDGCHDPCNDRNDLSQSIQPKNADSKSFITDTKFPLNESSECTCSVPDDWGERVNSEHDTPCDYCQKKSAYVKDPVNERGSNCSRSQNKSRDHKTRSHSRGKHPASKQDDNTPCDYYQKKSAHVKEPVNERGSNRSRSQSKSRDHKTRSHSRDHKTRSHSRDHKTRSLSRGKHPASKQDDNTPCDYYQKKSAHVKEPVNERGSNRSRSQNKSRDHKTRSHSRDHKTRSHSRGKHPASKQDDNNAPKYRKKSQNNSFKKKQTSYKPTTPGRSRNDCNFFVDSKKQLGCARIRNKQPLYVPYAKLYEPVIREIEADLFQASTDYSLAHCVAADFAMGAGIAVQFKKLFGGVNDLYNQNKGIGEVAVLQRDGRYIFYLITKRYSKGKPTMNSITRAIWSLRSCCEQYKVKKLAIPRIGCGLDGLDWNEVKHTLYEVFQDSSIQILVHVI